MFNACKMYLSFWIIWTLKKISLKIILLMTCIRQGWNYYHLDNFNCPDASGKKRIRYHLPHLINNSSNLILSKVFTHSRNGFKMYLKKHLINDYDDSPCVEINCYSCSFLNRITWFIILCSWFSLFVLYYPLLPYYLIPPYYYYIWYPLFLSFF